jgi:multicomponent Na+:H+ antiporter subunit G
VAQILATGFLLVGALFMFLAAVGLLRMPDLFTRMHANTKSATLGVGCLMIGTAIYFADLATATRALAVVVFLFITVPVGSHLIARAAYFAGVPLWEGTLSDELAGHYDVRTHELVSQSEEQHTPESR